MDQLQIHFFLSQTLKFYTNVIYIICQYFLNLTPNAFGISCYFLTSLQQYCLDFLVP